MIHNVPCFNKSYHPLDKSHLLAKEWTDNVNNKLNGNEPKKIVGILLLMLGYMLDYVETKDKMMRSLNHFYTYYKKVKCSLVSDYVTEAIDKIVISVKKQIRVCCSL